MDWRVKKRKKSFSRATSRLTNAVRDGNENENRMFFFSFFLSLVGYFMNFSYKYTRKLMKCYTRTTRVPEISQFGCDLKVMEWDCLGLRTNIRADGISIAVLCRTEKEILISIAHLSPTTTVCTFFQVQHCCSDDGAQQRAFFLLAKL